MNCPICKGELYVTDTRLYRKNKTYRRKRCDDCGNVFSTLEVITDLKRKYFCSTPGCNVELKRKGYCVAHGRAKLRMRCRILKSRVRICKRCSKTYQNSSTVNYCWACRQIRKNEDAV